MATKKNATKTKSTTAPARRRAASPGAGETSAGAKKASPKTGKSAPKSPGNTGKSAPKAPAKTGTAGKAATAGKAGGSKVAVRNSPIHGRGMYAVADIAKGERVIEYRGTIISWKAADERPPSDPNDPNHTFLFSLSDGKRVIDASQEGNDARWINHSCDPNCETEESRGGRVYIEAIRDIRSGEELNYDYCLIVDEKITKKLRLQYACRCGAANCRGTMLAVPKKKKKKKKH